MSEIDLSEVVDDSTLADEYTIKRSTGSFQRGGWVTTSIDIPSYGTVGVASEEDLQMIPEGDRLTGAMQFHSSQRIYLTQLDQNTTPGTQRVADQILWNFELYRILHVAPQRHRGYWKAIGVRMAGY